MLLSQEEWDTVQDLIEVIAKALEVARDKEIIGSSLDADLVLYIDEKLMGFLNPLSKELRFLFITSSVSLAAIEEADDNAIHSDNFAVSVQSSEFEKCNRCWHRQQSVNQSIEYPDLCSRCEGNITEQSEQRVYF